MLYSVKNVVEGFEEIDYNDGVRTLFLYTDGKYGVVQTGYTTVRGNKIFNVPKYSREFYDKVLEIDVNGICESLIFYAPRWIPGECVRACFRYALWGVFS